MVRRGTAQPNPTDSDTQLIGKLMYDLRCYSNQINREATAAETDALSRARIAYSTQKITAVVNALENLHKQASAAAPQRVVLGPEAAAAVRKLVDGMLTRRLDKLRAGALTTNGAIDGS